VRIAIDVRRLSDFGVGTYIRNLLNALAVQDRTNQYFLIAHPNDAAQLSHLPSTFKPVFYERSDTGRLEHILLPLFLRRLSLDLVHFPLNRVPLLLRLPYVVTIHDMGILIFSESGGAWHTLRHFRFSRGLSRAAKVIAVSAATRRDVHNLLGIPEERIQIVYNAPAPEFFDRDGGGTESMIERRRILERYQIHYPFLLYAGNIRPQKNIPRLVEAFAVARTHLEAHPVYKDLRLIIIGDEISKYPAVRRAVMQSRVEQSVRFLGFVPFDTLRVFYELAAAFVFPSLYEGFGLPPLEAMASGTPVITSEVSALPEAAGEAALLVNPENVFEIARAIQEILLDGKLRETLIAKGRIHAASFSWERNAREVIGIYAEVGHKSISKTEAK
jgi:glycosyltransferase involved in cell wall biosynthesis